MKEHSINTSLRKLKNHQVVIRTFSNFFFQKIQFIIRKNFYSIFQVDKRIHVVEISFNSDILDTWAGERNSYLVFK